MLSPNFIIPQTRAQNADAVGWKASLNLAFRKNPNQPSETLAQSSHMGPLRIQKLLYPEGPALCHAIMLHPPGGIAGGDDLSIQVKVDPGAKALITTPGATRWYGTTGATAMQSVSLKVGGECEWLPMETIVYERAKARSEIQFDCGHDARMLGWDTVIFGRHAFGEQFSEGSFHQTISCRFNDRLVWQERTCLQGDDELFNSPIGLCGQRAATTLWAIRSEQQHWLDDEIDALRKNVPEFAWSVLWPRLLVGRRIGEPLALKVSSARAWAQLRPLVFHRPAVTPRIWST